MYSVLLHDHAFLVVLWLWPLILLFMAVETVDMELAWVPGPSHSARTVLKVVYITKETLNIRV